MDGVLEPTVPSSLTWAADPAGAVSRLGGTLKDGTVASLKDFDKDTTTYGDAFDGKISCVEYSEDIT